MTHLLLVCLLFQPVQDQQTIFEKARTTVPFHAEETLGALLVRLGLYFQGTPYEGGTLDGNDEEQLVVHFQGMDCFTFMENTLAMAQALNGDGSYEAFLKALREIRYRRGKLDGYSSRLHYTTDWAYENARRGVLEDITAAIGGVPYPKTVHFMSTHHDKYPHLADPQNLEKIKQVETAVNQRTYHYIPEEHLQDLEAKIQEGDILALTTPIEGLDVVHVGLAVFREGRLHMLHASSANKQVEISPEPLVDYLKRFKSRNGVLVLRPRRS